MDDTPSRLSFPGRYASLEQRRRSLGSASIWLTPEIKRKLASKVAAFEQNRVNQMAGLPLSQRQSDLEEAVLSLWESRPAGRKTQLLELAKRTTGQTPAFRVQAAARLSSHHQPLAAQRIPDALDRFFTWVDSPAFQEMHPLEQLTLAQLRLLEIVPFEGVAQVASHLFSYQFLVDSDYLVPVYETGDLENLAQAIDSGFQFATQPFLDLSVRACLRAYAILETA